MRIYCGKFLNFSDKNILKACINLRDINETNITLNKVLDDLSNRTFQVLYKTFYKEHLNQNIITNGNNSDFNIALSNCNLTLKIKKLEISIDEDLKIIQKELQWLNSETDNYVASYYKQHLFYLKQQLNELKLKLYQLHESGSQQLFLQDLCNSENIQALLLNLEILLENNNLNVAEHSSESVFFDEIEYLIEELLICFNQTNFRDQTFPNLENLVNIDINVWKEQGKLLLKKLNEQLEKLEEKNYIPV